MIQESESASKHSFIHGHFFGAAGVLIGTATKSFCLPLSIKFHDGNQCINDWLGKDVVSHTVHMLRDGTRAKKNCIAYEKPGPYKGRGRRPLCGDTVHLQELFKSGPASFQKAALQIYGCEKEVHFLSKIYLWGQKLYQPLQFVLAGYDGKQIILEAMFREMKQQLGAFFYHFWTKAAPKLNRYSKKGSPDPLNKITDKSKQTKIIEAPSKSVMSEASLMAYLRRNLFCFMAKQKQNFIFPTAQVEIFQ